MSLTDMRIYTKKAEAPAALQELLEALNKLPTESDLDRMLGELRAIGPSLEDSSSIERFRSTALGFLNGFDQGLIDYLSMNADRTSVFSWFDLLEALSAQRKALKKVIARFQAARRLKSEPKSQSFRAEVVTSLPRLEFKSDPEKGSLAKWFDENEWPHIQLASGDVEKTRALRAKAGAEVYVNRTEAISVNLWLSWDAGGYLTFRGMPLFQILAGGDGIVVERLGRCPICEGFFYAKKLGEKRVSLTCGAKACSDKLGNLRRKRNVPRSTSSKGIGSNRGASRTFSAKRKGGKNDAD